MVSEADFIAGQDMATPRGPAGPAVRRCLLAGLLACGRCGRRWNQSGPTADPFRPGSTADGHGTPASFRARVIRAALCPASRWANIHVTTGAVAGSDSRRYAPALGVVRLVRVRAPSEALACAH